MDKITMQTVILKIVVRAVLFIGTLIIAITVEQWADKANKE